MIFNRYKFAGPTGQRRVRSSVRYNFILFLFISSPLPTLPPGPPPKLRYFLLTWGLLGFCQSHSPHFGRFLRASIFELDLDWLLYPFWGPKWVQNATKLILNLSFSCSGVVSDFLECQVDVHAPFWSGLFSFDPRFSLEKHSVFERFLAWQSIASPTKSH